jgi:hypothetical protein
MNHQPIKRGQVWKQIGHDFQIVVTGKSGGKWKCKVLTDRPGVFNGTHSMVEFTFWKKYELIK